MILCSNDRDCAARPSSRFGLLWFQAVLGIITMILHPSSHGSFGDIVRFSNLFGTPYSFVIEDNYFGPDLHYLFHPEVPDWCF